MAARPERDSPALNVSAFVGRGLAPAAFQGPPLFVGRGLQDAPLRPRTGGREGRPYGNPEESPPFL